MTWLAADYDGGLIAKWFDERNWPQVSRATLSFYRKKYNIRIDEIRKERRESALNEGLALKEERIKRLAQHADSLDAIKWQPDERGRLWNEKAWRETLADIAAETGGRKQGIEIGGENGGAIEIGVKLIDYRTGIAPVEAGSGSNSETPSQDESPGDGA